jgi:lysophospholipase L1-like esterase
MPKAQEEQYVERALVIIVILLMAVVPTKTLAGKSVRVVCLGDSITKAVPYVAPDQTFEVILQGWLSQKGISAEIISAGVGGEQTDQGLKRLEKDVIALKPDYVTIMYGANDSAVDEGQTGSRVTTQQFERNLRRLVYRLRRKGIKPILMTPPPIAPGYVKNWHWPPYTEQGPNAAIYPFIPVVRRVAANESAPLVDNFAAWAELALMGRNLEILTADSLHPNAEGQRILARTIYPVLARQLGLDPDPPTAP